MLLVVMIVRAELPMMSGVLDTVVISGDEVCCSAVLWLVCLLLCGPSC